MSTGETRVVKWKKGQVEEQFISAVVEAGGLEPGAVVLLDYAHDNGCPRVEGGTCWCHPDVVATILPAQGAA